MANDHAGENEAAGDGAVSRRTVLKTTGAAGAIGALWPASDAVAAAAADQSADAAWPSFQYDAANTGHAPDAVGPTTGAATAWTVETGGLPASRPAVADGTAYLVTTDGTVHAVRTDDGEREWAVETAHDYAAPPVVAGDAVYVALDDEVLALSTADGTVAWRRSFDADGLALDVADGTVYAQSDEWVRALAAADGERQWEFSQGGLNKGRPHATADRIYVVRDRLYALDPDGETVWTADAPFDDTYQASRPVRYGETVCVADQAGRVRGFDAESGDHRWTFEVEGFGLPALATDGDRVYVTADAPGIDVGAVHALSGDDGSRQWTTETGAYPTAPALGDGVVYVGTDADGGRLTALAAADGSEEWARDVPVETDPVAGDAALYVGAGTGDLRRVETMLGSDVWRYDTGGEPATGPVVAAETLVVGRSDDVVQAVSRSSGAERWSVETDRTPRSVATDGEETVYVSQTDGSVVALGLSDGTERWRAEWDEGEPTDLALADGTLYASGATAVGALDPATGEQRWTWVTDGTFTHTAPAVADGAVFVTQSGDGDNLYRIDAESGTADWSVSTGDNPVLVTAPAVAGGVVYFAGGDTTYAYSAADGAERWRHEGERYSLPVQPAVAGGTVLAGSGDSLYGLDAADGSREWRTEVPRSVTGPPVVADGVAYVGTAGGVRAISVADGGERWVRDVGEWVDEALAVVDGTVFVAAADGGLRALREAEPPTAAFSYSPETPVAGETVTFDASESADPDGSIETYRWDLDGDGSLGPTGETVEHAYDEPGEYTVTLEVTDDQGRTARVEETVAVAEPTPTPTASPTPAAAEKTDAAGGESGDAAASTTTEGADEPAATAEDGPGFGPLVALGALGAGAWRAVRGADGD